MKTKYCYKHDYEYVRGKCPYCKKHSFFFEAQLAIANVLPVPFGPTNKSGTPLCKCASNIVCSFFVTLYDGVSLRMYLSDGVDTTDTCECPVVC